MKLWKDSAQFYAQHFSSLMILAVTVLLPILIIQYVTADYVYFSTALIGMNIVGDWFDGFLIILFFTVAQLPFVAYVYSYTQGEEQPLRKAYRTFCEYGFSVFLFGLMYAFAVFAGLYFLVIPGFLVLIYFFFTPYIIVFEKQTARHTFRQALQLGKTHFFPLLGLIGLSALIEVILSAVVLVSVLLVMQQLLVPQLVIIVITQIVLSLFIFPYFAVLFTLVADKWYQRERAKQPDRVDIRLSDTSHDGVM